MSFKGEEKPARAIAMLAMGLVLTCSQSPLLADQSLSLLTTESRVVDFAIFWPPESPAAANGTNKQALLNGQAKVRINRSFQSGCVASIQIVLSRQTNEAGRRFWNSRLAFPQYDWMSQVRVWDINRRWLWPNLSYLLRLYGRERVERYGGVDPGKGIDNDFAAVLIRKYDAGGFEIEETKGSPLVSAEWWPIGATNADRRTVVHLAESDEFTLHLNAGGKTNAGSAAIWLIYADFLGAPPPSDWPKEPEYAGGILAFFKFKWTVNADGQFEAEIDQRIPPEATRFDWASWVSETRVSPGSHKTAKLSDLSP